MDLYLTSAKTEGKPSLMCLKLRQRLLLVGVIRALKSYTPCRQNVAVDLPLHVGLPGVWAIFIIKEAPVLTL